MALGRSKPKRSREPRTNQFGISLSPRAAKLLREWAAALDIAPTTLGRKLLEEALKARAGDAPGDDKVRGAQDEAARGGDTDEVLDSLLTELRALAASQRNATLKLLRQSGMSVDEVKAWAEKRLK